MDVSQPRTPGRRKTCPQCGCVIDDPIDQHIGVCSNLRCRGPYLAKKRQEKEAALREANRALIDSVLVFLSDKVDSELRSVVQQSCREGRLSKVPSCDEGLEKLPSDRLQKFSEHLRTVLQKAIAMLADARAVHSVLVEYAHRDWQTDSPPIAPVVNGCTTCRGYCCRNGGDTAFLTPDFIVWQLLGDPTLTIEVLERWYKSRLPEKSIDDSCVYHTQMGCAVPRKQRSNICNDFHCWELQEVRSRYEICDTGTWTSIATNKNSAVRIGVDRPGKDRLELEVVDPPDSKETE